MKKTVLFLCFAMLVSMASYGQNNYEYASSKAFPFGRPNPEAPKQIKDYTSLIGECNCKSISRKKDGSWNTPVDMIWKWSYIMNGMAVQDETMKADGAHSGSIRQFIADSSKWYVHYYSSKKPSTRLSTWAGNKKDGKIILYREQKAPNGVEGYYRLSFYDISESGYKWIGEWVDKAETIVYPTWKIECERKKS